MESEPRGAVRGTGAGARWLPPASAAYEGSPVAFYVLVVIALVSTARSLIHIFAPDGGAHSIAGLAIDVAGGPNLVALFGQWGAGQLVLALVYWVAILRYRFLVPFALSLVVVEQLLRILVGQLKPLVVADPPPGAIGSWVVLPIALVALALSLRRTPRTVA